MEEHRTAAAAEGQGDSPVGSVYLLGETLDLDALASRICERDRILLEGAASYWLQNGLDLSAAKRLSGHGSFEAWCKAKLHYSKSKAEKMMRAAALFAPMFKPGTVTDLPKPTLAYQLSAPSLPGTIRDQFVLRIVNGDKAAASEAMIAVKAHVHEQKDAAKEAKRRAALSPEQQAAAQQREPTQARLDAREEEKPGIELDERTVARDAAVALMVAGLGDKLPDLLAFAAQAGSGNVLGSEVERVLREVAGSVAAAETEQPGINGGDNLAEDEGTPALLVQDDGALAQNFDASSPSTGAMSPPEPEARRPTICTHPGGISFGEKLRRREVARRRDEAASRHESADAGAAPDLS